MTGSFQPLLLPAKAASLPQRSQERGWELVGLLVLQCWEFLTCLGHPHGPPRVLSCERFSACVTSIAAGQGLEEMDAHGEGWDCSNTGRMRRAGKPQPLSQVGA